MKTEQKVYPRLLNENMDVFQMMYRMSSSSVNGAAISSTSAASLIMMLISHDFETGGANVKKQLLTCDRYGIYGEKLVKLVNESCDGDLDKFRETIAAFDKGRYTREQIHARLNLYKAAAFV